MKAPEQKPLDPMDMHAPVEITIAVRMMTESGETARVMYDMKPGQIPTRAEIVEAIAPALDLDLLRALPMQGNVRPMTKPEFVAFITKRAAGESIPMAGDEHFVPAPCEVPHAMLVNAIIGAAECNKRGFDVLQEHDAVSLDAEDYRVYHVDVLLALPDEILMAIYERIAP